MPLLALFSRHENALAWGRQEAEKLLGEIALCSELFNFSETSYYDKSMGTELKKQFLVFLPPRDPVDLPQWKVATNALEEMFAAQQLFPEERPLNLDPGYLTEAKLVLATTKDRDHRLYLSDGIYAEVTLHFHHGKWTARPWTYPDYQRADYHHFFTRCRDLLRQSYSALS